MGLRVKNAKYSGFLPNLRTKVLNMIKTSVLVLLSGLFDRSRSRTVTALVEIRAVARENAPLMAGACGRGQMEAVTFT